MTGRTDKVIDLPETRNHGFCLPAPSTPDTHILHDIFPAKRPRLVPHHKQFRNFNIVLELLQPP